MSNNSENTQDIEKSAGRASDRAEQRSEKSPGSERLRNTVGPEAKKAFMDKEKSNSEKRKDSGAQTTGRRVFGKMDITVGPKKDVEVELKNNVPEQIKTADQKWERSEKNPQIWHVESGGEKFDLKADVRLKGDDITASVKYENGREVTYKNGEASKIVHPNGEQWTADPKHPGKWDVSAPNKDDPDHPKKFSISNVEVNPKDGDIKWHVDAGAGKGHDREIDSHDQYHDTAPAHHEASHAHNETLPFAHEAHHEAQNTMAPEKHFPEHGQDVEKNVPQTLQSEVQNKTRVEDQAGSSVLRSLEQIESVPQVQVQNLQETQSSNYRYERQIAQPQPHQPAEQLSSPARPQAPEQHLSQAKPLPPEQHLTTHPNPLPAEQHLAPQPKPLAPEQHLTPTPGPILRPLERTDAVPTPQMQKIEDAPMPKPMPPRELNNAAEIEKHNQEMIEQNLKSIQERAARAQAEAQIMLPRVAANSMEIPHLDPSAKATKSPDALPVTRPAVLHADLPSPTLVKPESHSAQIEAPAPVPLDIHQSQPAPQPMMHSEHYYQPAAPAPIPIDTSSGRSPGPVPVPMEDHHVHGADGAPAPVRASGAPPAHIDVLPSIPKPEAPPQQSRESAPPDLYRANQSQHEQEQEHTRLQGRIESNNNARQSDQIQPQPQHQQESKPFKLGASVQGERVPSPYDHGPQAVYDSTQRVQPLQGHAQDHGGNPRMHAQAAAGGGERVEQGPLCDGQGMVQLVSVDHRVPLTVNGVRANQGAYEANLSSPARGRDGKPLPGQVTWVSGRIQGGTFYIEQAAIDNGQPFHTMGALPLRQRR